jgi:tetratricopeptide (TPR) repeat protein
MPDASTEALDLTTMSLEEQATRLFNRVMTSNSAGDTADVAFFLPKALTIYEQVAPTDPDGIYHYALLFLVGGDFQAAFAKAQEGLVQVPDYLLLLAAGAEAAIGVGDRATAGEYYGHFLEVYDAEMGLARPGYDHHQPILPAYREDASVFLGQG